MTSQELSSFCVQARIFKSVFENTWNLSLSWNVITSQDQSYTIYYKYFVLKIQVLLRIMIEMYGFFLVPLLTVFLFILRIV